MLRVLLVAIGLVATNPCFGQAVLHKSSGPTSVSGYGAEVSTAADLNHDGIGDYLVRDSTATGTDEPTVSARSGLDGAFIHQLVMAVDVGFGVGLDGGADVDQDGTPDFLVGAPTGTPNGPGAPLPHGSAWLYSGANAQPLFHHQGSEANDWFGHRVRFLSDVDADGFVDYAVQSSYFFATNKPEVVTVFSGFSGQVLRTHTAGALDHDFGDGMASCGDTNGDGGADYLISAPRAGFNLQGTVTLFDGLNGSELAKHSGQAQDFYGALISAVGDVDGDSVRDYGVIHGSPALLSVVSTTTGSVLSGYASPSGHWLGLGLEATDDVDGDGVADLVAGCVPAGAQPDPALLVFSSATAQVLFRFERPASSQDPVFPIDVASLDDVDGDGRSEWLASSLFEVDPDTGGRGVVRVLTRRPLVPSANRASYASPVVDLMLSLGVPQAGGSYLVAASCSGTGGFPFLGQTVPLTFDACTAASAQFANSVIFDHSLGTLDASTGGAVARFDVSLLPPSANGVTLWFAGLGLGPQGAFVTNAEPILLDLFGP